jgi:hypothetical protein
MWFFILILGVLQIGEVVGVRLVDLCLEGKYESAMQCTLKGKVPILKLDLMVEKGE